MLSLCHIFSDAKFVDFIFDYFKSDLFINKAIYIGNDNSYKGKYRDSMEFMSYQKSGISSIIKICRKYDVIIFHNLSYVNAVVANRLPSGTKMIWRFFGTEFYSMPQNRLNIFSDKTKDALNVNDFYHMKVRIFENLLILRWAFQLKIIPRDEINRAIKKIEYILAWDKDEYSYVRKHWRDFPKLIELSAWNKFEKKSSLTSKNNNIVIGHSRAPECNHIDIIDFFEDCPPLINLSLVFPLNYGEKGHYYRHLIRRLKSSKLEIQILDKFLPYEIYIEKVVNSKAAIMNSYRQMALGNIFLFLANDVKVYLSEKNPSYNYLRRLGFTVFSVESNLKNDIVNNDLTLEISQAQRNRTIVDDLSDDRRVTEFHNIFYKYLSN